jgi:hypothetical protein
VVLKPTFITAMIFANTGTSQGGGDVNLIVSKTLIFFQEDHENKILEKNLQKGRKKNSFRIKKKIYRLGLVKIHKS